MSFAQTIIQRIRDRRADAKTSKLTDAYEDYRNLLIRTNNGDEIDPAEAEAILEAAGKSEQDFVRDTDVMRRRLEAERQLMAAEEASKKLKPLKAKYEKMVAEYNEVVQRLQPQINASYSEIQVLEGVVANGTTGRNTLSDTALDPRLAIKKQALDEKRRKLVERKQKIEMELSGRHKATVGYNLLSNTGILKRLEQQKKLQGGHLTDFQKQEIAETKRIVGIFSEQAKKLQAELDGINKGIEQCELDSQKLWQESWVP